METKEILDFQDQNIDSTFELASTGKRFINFIIDRIAYYIIVVLIGAGIGFGLAQSGTFGGLNTESTWFTLADVIISLLLYAIFYIAQESLLKGKTLGKYLTGTRAVNEDNSEMNLETIVKRSFTRIVPFEPFSFFGSTPRGWHDRWSNTKVIVDKNWRS
jgi:uncharacterized RDD family membrane protein YckC